MLQLDGPPWNSFDGETVVPDSPAFDTCRDALDSLSAGPKSEVTERRFSHHPRWGDILRAKIHDTIGGVQATTLFTCWDDQRSGAQIIVMPASMFR